MLGLRGCRLGIMYPEISEMQARAIFEAACKVAVYLHGSAGELADADNGEVSMTAGDLVDHIGDAILEVTARRRVATKQSE